MQYGKRNARGVLQKPWEVQESHLGCVMAQKVSWREDTSKLKPEKWEEVEPSKREKGKERRLPIDPWHSLNTRNI